MRRETRQKDICGQISRGGDTSNSNGSGRLFFFLEGGAKDSETVGLNDERIWANSFTLTSYE